MDHLEARIAELEGENRRLHDSIEMLETIPGNEWKRRAEAAEAELINEREERIAAKDWLGIYRAKLARAVELLKRRSAPHIPVEDGCTCWECETNRFLAALQDAPRVAGEADPITDCDKLREERDRLREALVKLSTHPIHGWLSASLQDSYTCTAMHRDVEDYFAVMEDALADTPEQSGTCRWIYSGAADQVYLTSCGERHAHRYPYCPYCGTPIEITGGEDE
jgi:hypothetical protein